MSGFLRSRLGCALVCAPLLLALPAIGEEDAVPERRTASDILGCAFDTRFERDLRQIVDLRVKRADRTLRHFRLQYATQRIDGHTRALAIFLLPNDSRSTRVLTIERSDGQDEHFLYMPVLMRTRRVFGGRRAEPFLGSDFSFEDWERLRPDEFEARRLGDEDFGGEPVWVIETVPRYRSGYVRSLHRVAQADCATLEIVHYKHGRDEPAKIIETPREVQRLVDGALVPLFARAVNVESDQSTEVHFSKIQVGAELPAELFEASTLERLRRIPDMDSGERPADSGP